MGKIISLDNMRKKERQISVAFCMINPTSYINFQTQDCFEAMLVHSAHQRLSDGRCKYQVQKITKKATNVFDGRMRVSEAAIEGGFEYILMIDSDMVFPADSLERLIAHDKDVVSALAFTKMEPIRPVMGERVDPDDGYKMYSTIVNWVDNSLVKVDGVGTAFLLFKTAVLKRMKKPWFSCPWQEESQKHLGSDYYFCAKAIDTGSEIYTDTSLKIGHIGEHIYGFDDYVRSSGPVRSFDGEDGIEGQYETLANYQSRKQMKAVVGS